MFEIWLRGSAISVYAVSIGDLYFYHDGTVMFDCCSDGVELLDSHSHKEICIPMPVKEVETANDVVQNPKHYELFEDYTGYRNYSLLDEY